MASPQQHRFQQHYLRIYTSFQEIFMSIFNKACVISRTFKSEGVTLYKLLKLFLKGL